MSTHKKLLCQERGQTLTEYAGIGLVVVALIAVVAGGITAASGTAIGEAIVCKINQQIHSIGGGSYECAGSGSTDKDPYAADPGAIPSHVEETNNSTSAGASIPGAGPGNIDVNGSDGSSLTKTTYKDGSGDRQYSKTQEGSVGYSVSAGTGGGDGGDGGEEKSEPFKAEIGASGKVSASHTTTETYKCDTADHVSCSDFDKQNKDATDERLNDEGVGRLTSGDTTLNQTPDSTSTAWNAKLSLSAEASASADAKPKVGKDDKDNKNKDDKNKDGKSNEGTEVAHAEAKASLGISGEAGYTHTDTTDKDGNTSTSHKFTYQGKAEAQADASIKDPTDSFGLEAEAGGDRSYVGSYEVTYDENGNLSTITFTNVMEGQGSWSATGVKDKDDAKHPQTSTITTTLDVSKLSPEDRATAEQYASSSFTNGALTVPQSALNPSSPSDDSFDNLLYEQAQTTRVVQDGSVVTDSGGWDLWVANYNTESVQSTKDTVSAQQLGKPGSDGQRSYEDVK